MAIGLLFHRAGGSQEQYEQILNEVMPNGERVPGLLSHHAGLSEDGFCVIETWESQEALQRFFEERLGQALARANVQGQPTIFQITNSL
jgi:heme-degrading monooxygenase HmoA